MAIMILKNGGDKLEKPETCIRQFVRFTSDVERSQQGANAQPHLYVHQKGEYCLWLKRIMSRIMGHSCSCCNVDSE